MEDRLALNEKENRSMNLLILNKPTIIAMF